MGVGVGNFFQASNRNGIVLTEKNYSTSSNTSLLKNPMVWSLGSLAGSFFVLMLFRLMAEQEILFSNWFYNAQACGEAAAHKIRCGYFPARRSEGWIIIRKFGLRLPQVFAAIVLVWLIYILWFKNNKSLANLMRPLHGLLSLIIGPFFLTNVIFKPFWGRPRPSQTMEFNGNAPYVLPGDISSSCVGNCSFVSGEATAAFWMLWIVPFLPSRWRWLAGVCIFVLACMISLLRVAFGGHFLSDVVIGAGVAIFSIALSAWILQIPIVRSGIEVWNNFSNRHSWAGKLK